MTQDDAWIEKFADEVNSYAIKGRYREGLAVARAGLKKYPDALVVQYLYAKLLGDWADELPPARKKKLKGEAVRILRPLRRRLSGQPLKRRFGICLNYYYQSEEFKAMHAFGKRLASEDRRLGLYAQGIGACLYAEELRARRPSASATATASAAWARKSVRAWRGYGLAKEKYYFAHYTFAKALALAGDGAEALRNLKKAARLSDRDVSDWEFQDVVKLIEEN